MKKDLIVIQDGAKDCGASCLLSIIRYYGGNISKEKLIDMTKTTKDGTTFFGISSAAESLGLTTKSYKVDDIDKIKKIIPPILCQINNNGYNHFIIIYKIYNNRLLIMDPSKGKEVIDLFDFNNIWTGYIMLFEKSLPLINNKENKIFGKIIKEVIIKNKGNILFITILSLIITTSTCLASFYSEVVFDKVIDTEINNLIFITLIFFILFIIKNITNFIRNHLLIYLNQKLDISIILNAFSKIILLPYRYYKNKTTAEVLSRINDLSYVKKFISKIIITIFLDTLVFIIAFIIIYTINRKILNIFILTEILYLIIILIFNKTIKKYTTQSQKNIALINSAIVESVSSFETIKGLNIEDNIIYKFSQNYSKALNTNYNLEKLNNTISLLKEIITDISLLLINFYSFKLIMTNHLTIGNYMTITMLSNYLIYPIRNIINLTEEYHYVKNSITRANNLFEVEDENIYDNKKLEVNGNIKITNLKYTFNNKNYILKNINLFIKDKDRVILLGPSGSGKSTILKILYKYLEVDRKTVYINGYDINDYSLIDIRKNITYISQNEIIYNDTIRNNIILDREVSEIDYLNICHLLHIDDIVKDNILGYDYILEENAINLSGGQRQKIILARSLLKRSNIIMIDEGFSQIDIETEREILQNIFRYFYNKTFIVISHRTENLDLYNRIIKIKEGKIKEISEVKSE
ncbi:MAG: peptidase domain-containing ABC transporter [Bacilli bacterium]